MYIRKQNGFTIVELLIVIVVIAILAAITIVAFTGIQNRARDAAISSKETQAKKKLEAYKVDEGHYPSGQSEFDTLISQSPDDKFYTSYSSTAPYDAYILSTSGGSGSGGGNIADGAPIQTITTANCPTSRIRAVDIRDNRTYWVLKLADGKCWMLTNLAYAGGGTNTYSDTITLANGTGGARTYTVASYYIPTGANFTTEPAAPSTATTGTGQYGYLYNWCAAMGNQQNTSACLNADTPLPATSISICPTGWRLPTSPWGGGDFAALNNAINGGSTSNEAGLIGDPWLLQRSGVWGTSFGGQGTSSRYWSSSPSQSSVSAAYNLYLGYSSIDPWNSGSKDFGFAVRCVAN